MIIIVSIMQKGDVIIMKKFKKLSLILIGLILVVSLVACGSDNTDKDELDTNEDSMATDDIQDEQLEAEEDEDNTEDVDSIDEMIESSDYISKIKSIQKGGDAEEIKILDNIKGSLSSTDLPAIEDLKMNKPYIIFLKDVDGNLVLSHEEDGLILLEGDNHELFEKINKKLHTN